MLKPLILEEVLIQAKEVDELEGTKKQKTFKKYQKDGKTRGGKKFKSGKRKGQFRPGQEPRVYKKGDYILDKKGNKISAGTKDVKTTTKTKFGPKSKTPGGVKPLTKKVRNKLLKKLHKDRDNLVKEFTSK